MQTLMSVRVMFVIISVAVNVTTLLGATSVFVHLAIPNARQNAVEYNVTAIYLHTCLIQTNHVVM